MAVSSKIGNCWIRENESCYGVECTFSFLSRRIGNKGTFNFVAPKCMPSSRERPGWSRLCDWGWTSSERIVYQIRVSRNHQLVSYCAARLRRSRTMLPPGTAPQRSGFSTEMPLERYMSYMSRSYADVILTSFHHLQTNFPLLCSRRRRHHHHLLVAEGQHDFHPSSRYYQNDLLLHCSLLPPLI